MSESRGLTLRKKKTNKRPVISAPQQKQTASATTATTSTPSTAAKNTQLRPSNKRQGQSETSDLVKRRYSTRYNQLPNFSGNIPDVPSLPGAGLKRRSQGGSPSRPAASHNANPLRIDLAALSDPNLQHERYVTDLLSNATESDIREYQQNLSRIKRRNSIDLQQTIYQNRTQFIKISKEAESLKGEMSNLRGLMAELTTALEQSSAAAGSTININGNSAMDAKARRQANRSSVANLEAMWNSQLQALWKSVEKSQKFLPAVPGRHVIMENGSWIELDSATWKPKRPVHVVLLNDHLLVASKKRKKIDPNVPQTGPAPTKLVAEECWPLSEIDLIDMSANASHNPSEEKAVTAAITIRSGGRSWVYRQEKKDQAVKSAVLSQVRKAQEDLRKASLPRSDPVSARKELSYLASRDPSSAKLPETFAETSVNKLDKPDVFIEIDGKPQSVRVLESQIDDLDIDIALQHSDVAVAQIEKIRHTLAPLKRSNPSTADLITAKIDERAAKLASILCRELVDTPSFIEATKRTTSLLIRLGFEDRAREAYLKARGDMLTKRQRQCVFDGDLHKYIFSISYVYFTVIKNTVQIFQASFPASTLSACIKWAHGNLEVFNALLVRQLSAIEKDGRVWRDCMDVVWAHEHELLGDVGLDFREVIGRGLEFRESRREARSRSRTGSRSESRTRGT